MLFFMFGCSILFAIVEQGSSEPQVVTVLEQLDDFSIWRVLNPINIITGFFTGEGSMQALISIALFDYKMFESGSWQFVRYMMLIPPLVWLIATGVAMVRGTSSA